MNKHGDEIVEAAMVLPILILTILSLILLILYFFSCLTAQTGLHEEMVRNAMNSQAVFEINKNKEETSAKVDGVIAVLMKKEIDARLYTIREADLIRTGEMLHD